MKFIFLSLRGSIIIPLLIFINFKRLRTWGVLFFITHKTETKKFENFMAPKQESNSQSEKQYEENESIILESMTIMIHDYRESPVNACLIFLGGVNYKHRLKVDLRKAQIHRDSLQKQQIFVRNKYFSSRNRQIPRFPDKFGKPSGRIPEHWYTNRKSFLGKATNTNVRLPWSYSTIKT